MSNSGVITPVETHAEKGDGGQSSTIIGPGLDTASERFWYRRSLDQLTRRFGEGLLEKFISERVADNKRMRILEIGFGDGRALLQLRKEFPNPAIELHGINVAPDDQMNSQKDFITMCQEMAICSVSEATSLGLPVPHFYDAGEGLHFGDEEVDLIISQVAFHYVVDKARLVEEIWRVLSPGGLALVHVDSFNKGMPDFMNPGPFKPKFTPRWTIYDPEGNRVETADHIAAAVGDCSIGLHQSLYKPTQTNLIARKNNRCPIHLDLAVDDGSTLANLQDLLPEKARQNDAVWWGSRSVFRVV
jgi:SAM-dependent methyltransferase